MNDFVTGALGGTRLIDIEVRSGVPGPPGPAGPPGDAGPIGPEGPAGRTTTLVGDFGRQMTPADLPDDGFIPADWDAPGRPVSDLQVQLGEALVHLPDLDIFVFVGFGWANIGAAQGEPGPPGAQGVQGPAGAQGPVGPSGQQGTQGVRGDQGERGVPGPAGVAGPGGAQGSVGPAGPLGPPGPPGVQGERGEQGVQGDEGPPSFDDAPPGNTYGRLNAAWVQVLPMTGGTLQGGLTVSGPTRWLMEARASGTLSLDIEPTLPEHAVTKRYADAVQPDMSDYARLDGAQMTGTLLLAEHPTTDMAAVTKRYVDALPPPDLDALLPLDGSRQMTGMLLTARGTGNTNLAIGLGDNANGFWRSGSYIINVVGGATIWQASALEFQLGVRINMSNAPIINLADPAGAAYAVNQRFTEATYLRRDGGQMTGQLLLDGNPTSDMAAVPRLYVDSLPPPNLTPYARLDGAQFTGPVVLYAAPLFDYDAVSKSYVDQRRAPTFMRDIPVDYAIPDTGAWTTLDFQNYSIPRGGNSRIMVSLSVNGKYTGSGGALGQGIMFVAARILGNPERHYFVYGVINLTNQERTASGFTADLYADVTGTNPLITIQLATLDAGSAAPRQAWSVVGGDATYPYRSQYAIMDLGPI